jgi:hypothetical protein
MDGSWNRAACTTSPFHGSSSLGQEGLWIAHTELASAPEYPIYQRMNELLEAERFDEFVESRCAKFYAERNGRPSLTPGIYFRVMLIGFFEGIESERGIVGSAQQRASKVICVAAPNSRQPRRQSFRSGQSSA